MHYLTNMYFSVLFFFFYNMQYLIIDGFQIIIDDNLTNVQYPFLYLDFNVP